VSELLTRAALPGVTRAWAGRSKDPCPVRELAGVVEQVRRNRPAPPVLLSVDEQVLLEQCQPARLTSSTATGGFRRYCLPSGLR